jgi:hypothetical protein
MPREEITRIFIPKLIIPIKESSVHLTRIFQFHKYNRKITRKTPKIKFSTASFISFRTKLSNDYREIGKNQ